MTTYDEDDEGMISFAVEFDFRRMRIPTASMSEYGELELYDSASAVGTGVAQKESEF